MKKFIYFLAAVFIAACSKVEPEIIYVEPEIKYDTMCVTTESGESRFTHEDVIICNEGLWQSNNGQLSLYSGIDKTVSNQWFQTTNGFKLGDTPTDIIQVNDTTIAIAVNMSNIIQFIRPNGTACGATENIPNVRKLCVDDEGYVYATSYAHECNGITFTKGFVAKIDPTTYEILGVCEVGWEPEGIGYYNGILYICNTGGYSYAENHDYDSTISIVDCATMNKIKDVNTGVINLYSSSIVGNKMLISSPGDYATIPAMCFVFDCDTEEIWFPQDPTTEDVFPATYSSVIDGKFISIGAAFNYTSYAYEYYIYTIDPYLKTVTSGIVNESVSNAIKSMSAPNDLYSSPFTSNIYITDAGNYSSSGSFYAFDKNGNKIVSAQETYISPAHMLAVPHFVIEPVYTTTITITPHISYPTRSSCQEFNIDEFHRNKFVEAWEKARLAQ